MRNWRQTVRKTITLSPQRGDVVFDMTISEVYGLRQMTVFLIAKAFA